MESLAQRLGYSDDDRLLIISSDLMGTTHASTMAGYGALRDGLATTATLMMPGPWARYSAKRYRGEDIGVHLTLNAEFDCLRWGPLTSAPSLLDGDGGFPRTVADLWDHADLDEARRECRAQVERAILWGFDITHLSTHLSAMQQRPEFFDILLDIAVELDLPIRLEGPDAEQAAGFPFRRLAAEEGIVMPDHFSLRRDDARAHLEAIIADCPAGVTELALAPALDRDEIAAIDPNAGRRVDDFAVALDENLAAKIANAGIVLVGYRALRAAQRARR